MIATRSFAERIALYALLTSLTSLSIDALLPGLREIGLELPAAPPLSTQLIISLFVLGMGFGELLLGPLSDALGRKRALVLGIAVYLFGTLVAITASSLEVVVLGRFLQGLGVSGPKIATRAMIRDQFEGSEMARVMSFMFSLFILIPMIAPALAQGLIAVAGWRSVFIAYLLIATGLGLWLLLRQPETLPKSRRIAFRPSILIQNGFRILASQRVTLLIVATGLVFGTQLLYLSTAADLFFDAYGIEETFPIYFAVLASGIGLASFINGRMLRRFSMETMARAAFWALTAIGTAMLVACLLRSGHLPLPLFMAFGFSAFFAIGILFGNLNAMAMRTLGEVAGLGASLIASGSSFVASAYAMVFGYLYNGTPLNLAVSFTIAGISCVFLLKWALRSTAAPITAVR